MGKTAKDGARLYRSRHPRRNEAGRVDLGADTAQDLGTNNVGRGALLYHSRRGNRTAAEALTFEPGSDEGTDVTPGGDAA